MNKKIIINGETFDEKMGGMTLVDAYYIPDDIVETYRKDREYYAKRAVEIWKPHCAKVERDFKGSQDGEAIIGFLENGEACFFIHLDPDGIRSMKEADEKGNLEEFLLSLK